MALSASAVSSAASARRDNLDLFVKAVAEFQAVDGDVSLSALLAYLTAEDDQGNGLDVATPTAADSVKLLTVHRAKGLEWSSVFCVGVGEANMAKLGRFSPRQPLRLKGLAFREFFLWLSRSARAGSKSAPSDTIQMAAPQDWAVIPGGS